MKANHIKQKQDTNSITDFQYRRYSLTPKVTPGQADTAALLDDHLQSSTPREYRTAAPKVKPVLFFHKATTIRDLGSAKEGSSPFIKMLTVDL